MEKQNKERLSALQECVHFNQGDQTNERVKKTLTFKQFIGSLVVMWLVCTVAGKAISGRYWFDHQAKNTVERLADYNAMTSTEKIEELLKEIKKLDKAATGLLKWQKEATRSENQKTE